MLVIRCDWEWCVQVLTLLLTSLCRFWESVKFSTASKSRVTRPGASREIWVPILTLQHSQRSAGCWAVRVWRMVRRRRSCWRRTTTTARTGWTEPPAVWGVTKSQYGEPFNWRFHLSDSKMSETEVTLSTCHPQTQINTAQVRFVLYFFSNLMWKFM